jgi:putative FmdB family regulatory protein
MPIYEYKCAECGSISEFLTSVGEDENKKCRICGSTNLVRILSVGWFTLQDSHRLPGWTCCGREERCEIPPCVDDGT